MLTQKMYYTDSYIKEFSAVVLSCESIDGKNCVILDKTAFFPEGGGQLSDKGIIGDANVVDVQEYAGKIIHYTDKFLETGVEYSCKIDWDTRFRRMQQHTGEHIVSGIVNSIYGYDNVGFHMDEDYVTVDFNGELTREQLDDIENKANFAVYSNYNINCFFPDENQLSSINYRSKLDLSENVRLVKIENTDLCACCAPHLNRTGEVGIIKILDFMRHRGGVRIVMKSGFDALCDYRYKYKSVYDISGLLSAKQGQIVDGVTRVLNELDSVRRELVAFKHSVAENTKQSIIYIDNCSYCVVDGFDADMMRELANCGADNSPVCFVFSGNDTDGYSYISCSLSLDMKAIAKTVNTALNGRGGGRDTMIQGKVFADKKSITAFIENFNSGDFYRG